MVKYLLMAPVLGLICVNLSGCVAAALVGGGAAGGYLAKEHGYSLQSPLTKEK